MKKGFTLIELLAVIVILAIILIISIPLINGVIEGAKVGAVSSNAKMLAASVKNEYLKNQIENGTTESVIFENGVMTKGNIKFNGDIPDFGVITINKIGQIAYALFNDDYCASKSYLTDEVVVEKRTKDECMNLVPKPTITLTGASSVDVVMGQSYNELGYTALDENGNPTASVSIEITKNGSIVPSIDTSSIGTYIVKYIVSGESVTSEITRTVNIIDSCGYDFTDVRDGKSYKTVRIGTQCWFAENISYTGNGCLSNSMMAGSTTGCRSNGSSTYPTIYYQWSAAMNYTTTEGGQGICPAGWHVPSDSEFKTMEVYLGMSVSDSNLNNDWRISGGVGQKLKTSAWGGNNSANMNIQPSGYGWNDAPAPSTIGVYEFYWTSTQSGGSAWNRNLFNSSVGINRVLDQKGYGFSIRCVMN